jgi:ketosteroid isomerase-like protein
MTLEELQKKVLALEDMEAIKELHRQYVFWLNSQEWDEMIDCFTEDAIADIGRHGEHKGREEITKLFKVTMNNQLSNWNGGHFVTQPVISVNGDKATGHWFLHIFIFLTQTQEGPSYKWVQGRYDTEYIKVNGKWKFKVLRFKEPWPKQLNLGSRILE